MFYWKIVPNSSVKLIVDNFLVVKEERKFFGDNFPRENVKSKFTENFSRKNEGEKNFWAIFREEFLGIF